MNSDQLREALNDIERHQRAADYATNQALRLVVGRLRKGDSGLLRRLKYELRDFNMTTRRWKNG